MTGPNPLQADPFVSPFSPQPDPIAQGADSVPTAAPSPPANQPAGTPGNIAGGVVNPGSTPAPAVQQTQPDQGTGPQQPAPSTDVDPQSVLDKLEADEKEETAASNPDAAAIMQKLDAGEQEEEQPNEGHSILHNLAAGANRMIQAGVAYPVRLFDAGIGAIDVGIGKAAQALGGKSFGQTLQTAGEKIIQGTYDPDNNPELRAVQLIMGHIGGTSEGDKDSMAYKIGSNSVLALGNLMAIQAAAPTLAAKTGMGGVAIISRAIGNAALHNPWTGIIGEMLLGNPAATVAGEATDNNPTVAGLSGMAGNAIAGLAGNPVERVMGAGLKYGVKLTAAMAKVAVNTVDRVSSKLAGIEANPIGQPQKLVSDDIIDAYREAEQASRDAGQRVVFASAEKQEAIKGGGKPGFPAYDAAEAKLQMELAAEAKTNQAADKAWMDIPAGVRNQYSQQSEALRSEAADLVRPQMFAEEQLAGDRHLVNNKINDALNRVRPDEPGMTTEMYANRIMSGVQDAEKLASDMEGRLYSRASLKARLPDITGPQKDLDKAVHEMQINFHEDDIPQKAIQDIQSRLSPNDANGNPQKFPTLQQMRNVMTSLGQQRREELAKPAPNNRIVANLAKLQVLGSKWIGEAFPDNVPLQQARAFSQFYHSKFSTTDILPLLKTTVQGGQKIRPEDTLTELFRRPHGFSDIYKMVSALQDHPAYNAVMDTSPREINRTPTYKYQRLGQTQTGGGTPTEPFDPRVDNFGTSGKLLSGDYPPTNGTYGSTGKLFGPQDQARLQQLSSDIENGIRSSFQEELGKVISTPKTSTGELPSASESALKMQSVVNKWSGRIKSFSQASAEVTAAMQDALDGVKERRAIEASAMVKYFETNDPKVAIDRLWSSKNPAALARNLISGEAGVGGFMKDAAALEGFRSALIDKLFDQAKDDPRGILRILAKQPQISRLLATGLGTDRLDRLHTITSNLVKMQENQMSGKWAEVIVTAARLGSLKLSAALPKIGEGAELMQASIFAQTAKRMALGAFHKDDAIAMLKEAIRNPEAERLMLQGKGGNWRGYTDAMRDTHRDALMLRRVLRFGDGIIQGYNATQSDNENGPDPVDHRPSLANSNLNSPFRQTADAAEDKMRQFQNLPQPPTVGFQPSMSPRYMNDTHPMSKDPRGPNYPPIWWQGQTQAPRSTG